MGITELVELVRAGLDADWDAAQWASAGPWWVEAGEPQRWGDQRDSEVACSKGTVAILGCDRNGALNAEHIVRSADPATVLRDVAAKRVLLNQALAWEHGLVRWDHNTVRACEVVIGKPCDCGRDERVLQVLQALAAPYQET